MCPPWRPWPFPIPYPGPFPWEPDPQPWQEFGSAQQIEVAYLLTRLSGFTTNAEFNVALKALATRIARGVAGRVVEEFERCGTKPRPPLGPRR